jgi:outer membrane protein OmpA-like peptidoglycan-associated protein
MKRYTVFFLLFVCSCAGPYHGPDKQFSGTLAGAATGAGAGAVTGAQLGSATGPGAAIGAGFGAVVGGIKGFTQDQIDESLLQLANETSKERRVSVAQEVLADHYARRLELHPTRDIFPADIFFRGDESTLRPGADAIVQELARMNKDRVAWSRLVVACYIKSTEETSVHAQTLAERRSKQIINELTHYGIEPRRLVGRAVVVPAPVLLDPNDDPLRYSQAVELVAIDR